MDRRRRDDISEDSPIYSRLFIVSDRTLKEDDFREAFSEFGTIEDIRIPRDHRTGEQKGIVFIKFSKTSEAARALDSMNFKCLPNSSRPLKVMVAANRSDIQQGPDDKDTEKYRRLFVNIPKVMTEDELKEYFGQFGKVESVLIQRDKTTHESRGFAYIKYQTFLEAALVFEQCDRKYRPIFAMPKRSKRHETAFESNINLASSSVNRTSLISTMNVRPEGYSLVNFICSPYVTPPQIERLFDIVPGMRSCRYYIDLMNNYGKGTVQYSNPVSAAHAVAKLNEFEYPPGERVYVRPGKGNFNSSDRNFDNIPKAYNNLQNAIASNSDTAAPDLAQLANAIAEASKLIKGVTAGVTDNDISDSSDLKFCSVTLPAPQPLADIDSPAAKRCFLVCKPQPPPLTVLRDVFCRFGNLINVYTLPNKTVGYARYSTVESADNAIKTLHGAEICGVRMKVIEAEDEVPAKRMRFDY